VQPSEVLEQVAVLKEEVKALKLKEVAEAAKGLE